MGPDGEASPHWWGRKAVHVICVPPVRFHAARGVPTELEVPRLHGEIHIDGEPLPWADVGPLGTGELRMECKRVEVCRQACPQGCGSRLRVLEPVGDAGHNGTSLPSGYVVNFRA